MARESFEIAAYKAKLDAEFAFQQKVDRLKWQREVRDPEVEVYERKLSSGATVKVLELVEDNGEASVG
jgi:hypothetical protein